MCLFTINQHLFVHIAHKIINVLGTMHENEDEY